MVTRLRPLEVSMSFEDRSYKLGETIDITLELSARRDVMVNEGRVDIICQENYQQTFTVPVTKPAAPDSRGQGSPAITITGSKQVTQNRSESYSHGCNVFVSEARLRSGASSRHSVRLKTSQEPPLHMSDPTVTKLEVKWTLVATFDVAQARDVTERQPVRIALQVS